MPMDEDAVAAIYRDHGAALRRFARGAIRSGRWTPAAPMRNAHADSAANSSTSPQLQASAALSVCW